MEQELSQSEAEYLHNVIAANDDTIKGQSVRIQTLTELVDEKELEIKKLKEAINENRLKYFQLDGKVKAYEGMLEKFIEESVR